MSNDPNRIILRITPQSWVHIRGGKHGDKALFYIPEVCRKGRAKTGCVEYHRTGLCKHTLSQAGRYRKKRIERYNKYRADILALAKQAGFQLPTCGWSLYFYFPMPKRWTKKKKDAMVGQLHLQKPDTDNCLAAFFDSFTVVDEQIGQMSGMGKFWIKEEIGYIEILLNQKIHNPFGVVFIDQGKHLTMVDIQKLREERTRKRAEKSAADKKKKRKKRKPVQKELFSREDKIK